MSICVLRCARHHCNTQKGTETKPQCCCATRRTNAKQTQKKNKMADIIQWKIAKTHGTIYRENPQKSQSKRGNKKRSLTFPTRMRRLIIFSATKSDIAIWTLVKLFEHEKNNMNLKSLSK